MPRPPVQEISQLAETARVLRTHVIRMLAQAGSGHPGGSLSAADLVATLYFHTLNHDPANPTWPARDRLVLSKGHGVPVIYAALAVAGYFPVSELATLRQINTRLQGHPDMRRCPGIEACTGSLGQGLSIGIGMALAGRWPEGRGIASAGDSRWPEGRGIASAGDSHWQKQAYRTFVLMSDGETNEGQTWEAAAFAGFHRLANLTAILDANKFQLDGATADVLSMEPMGAKWQSFGWAVRELDGHDLTQIVAALDWARTVSDRPTMLIAHTVKGKGVSFMEHNNYFHGVAPTAEEAEWAVKELTGQGKPPAEFLAKVKRGGK